MNAKGLFVSFMNTYQCVSIFSSVNADQFALQDICDNTGDMGSEEFLSKKSDKNRVMRYFLEDSFFLMIDIKINDRMHTAKSINFFFFNKSEM